MTVVSLECCLPGAVYVGGVEDHDELTGGASFPGLSHRSHGPAKVQHRNCDRASKSPHGRAVLVPPQRPCARHTEHIERLVRKLHRTPWGTNAQGNGRQGNAILFYANSAMLVLEFPTPA